MASITQTIPSYTGGISQQPDELKVPGQVNVAKNVFPDITEGLMKRPGAKFIKQLDADGAATDSQDQGKWFHYYRDETEQYLGQIIRHKDNNGASLANDGKVNMWKCSDGSPVTVHAVAQPWVASTAYIVGQKVKNNSNVYECSTAGTSAGSGGPSGTSTAITDGNAKWDYVAALSGLETNIYNYLKHISDPDVQTLTVNDFTYITNRTKTTSMSSTKEADRPPEAFIELKKVAYASQYSVNLFDNTTTTTVTTATRIRVELIDSSNNYCDSNGFMLHHSGNGSRSDHVNTPITRVRCDDSAGDGNDAWSPNVGTRIFSIDHNKLLDDDGAVGGTKSGGSAATTTLSYNVRVFVKDATTPATEIADNYATGREKLYFRLTTTGQAVPYTDSSNNTTYQTRYTTTHDLLHGGQGWEEGDFFYVWMKDARYKITVEEVSVSKVQANLGLIRPTPTSFDTKTTVTAESILGAIRTGILGNSVSGTNTLYQWKDEANNNYHCKQIGNGLYISRPDSEGEFSVSSPVGELLNVLTNSVEDVADLPSQCKHGYVVKVSNSEAEEDDYYVKFIGQKKADGTYLDGEGVWEECAMPGTDIEFDAGTMPLQLVRQADGTFTLSTVTWDNAQVGDTRVDGTNPRPSFIGKTINKMLFFRNRLVLLSDENVIMSRPGDFYNFWAKSAIQFTATDPIDISCSSEYPAIIFDGIQVNSGLVLFTKNQQFMLTTDSDVLSPLTAKINFISAYNFNHNTNPFSLGTTIGFIDNVGKHSRFMEMARVLREGEPDVIEQSKVVSELIDKDLNIVSASKENGFIAFSEKDKKTLYCYKYFNTSDKRVHQAWFTWTFDWEIQYHFIIDDSIYIVTDDDSKCMLLKLDLQMHSDTLQTNTSDNEFKHRVHLDNAYQIPSEKAYKFTWNGSADYIDVYTTDSLGNVGTNVNLIFQPTLDSLNATNGTTYEVKGNYSGYVRIEPISPGSVFDNSSNANLLGTLPLDANGKAFGYVQVNASDNNSSAITTFMYDSINEKSIAPSPSAFNTNGLLYAISSNGEFAQVTVITYNSGLYFELPGDWTEHTNTFIGYKYEMEVEFPTIYLTSLQGDVVRSDTRSSIILHRNKINLGASGLYQTILKRKGKSTHTEDHEAVIADASSVADLPVQQIQTRVIPIYDRNTNITLTLKSTHPTPLTLYSMIWEGDYTNKFYKSV